MDTLALLQHYWWLIISLLGALLVFLLFVQGGQGLLYRIGKTEEERNMLVNSLGRKWEITFTTLVTFGAGFFASFPLFYSTSFGGASYVWVAILVVFVIQAVSYEFRRKPNNFLGEKTYDAFLLINGIAAPLLLGTAVGTFFSGANFTVDRLNLANGAGAGSENVISQWTSAWHGLEAIGTISNVILGVALVLLSMMLACQYFMNNIDDKTIHERSRKWMIPTALGFVVLFVVWLVILVCSKGWAVDPATGVISIEPYKYLHNFIQMPYVTAILLIGVVLVLCSVYFGWLGKRYSIWYGGIGTIMAVFALFLCAGWNNTSFYPSLVDTQSSLTIYNASSSLFTLKVMSYVSLLVPFVVIYIWFVWRALNRKPITREEIRDDKHLY